MLPVEVWAVILGQLVGNPAVEGKILDLGTLHQLGQASLFLVDGVGVGLNDDFFADLADTQPLQRESKPGEHLGVIWVSWCGFPPLRPKDSPIRTSKQDREMGLSDIAPA